MIFTVEQIMAFSLIFARVGGLIQLAPFFNSKQILNPAKVAIVILFSVLVIAVVPLPKQLPSTGLIFMLALGAEFLIGALIGFTSQILVIGIEFAGSLMDTQAGLSAASLLDPSSGQQTTILATFFQRIAVIVFLLIDGHHLLLSAVFQSFRLLPISAPVNFTAATKLLLTLGTNIFWIALQLSAPVLLVIFLIDFCFGMLSRVASQVNVFQLGFQVKPIAGVIIFLVVLSSTFDSIFRIMERITDTLLRLFVALQPI